MKDFCLLVSLFLGAALAVASNGATEGVQPSNATIKAYEWLDSLGLPDVSIAPWAAIYGAPEDVADEAKRWSKCYWGFIVRADDKGFAWITCHPRRQTDRTWLPISKPSTPLGYKVHSFEEFVRRELRLLGLPNKERKEDERPLLYSSTSLFFASYACWKRGHADLATPLFDAAIDRRRTETREKITPESFLLQLQDEFALQAVSDALASYCGGRRLLFFTESEPRLVSRPEFEAELQFIEEKLPSFSAKAWAENTEAQVRAMVAEDQNHPKHTDEQVAALPIDGQVQEWIYRLRDQASQPMSNPGWCNVVSSHGEAKTPADHLVRIGLPAVPQLIKALSDFRMTRSSQSAWGDRRPGSVLLVADCARQILSAISGRPLTLRDTRTQFSLRAKADSGSAVLARAWWQEVQLKGARQVLIDDLASGSFSPRPLCVKLEAKYPDAIADALVAGASLADARFETEFIDELNAVKSDAANQLLLKKMRGAKELARRVAAATLLWERNFPESMTAMLEEWRQIRKDASSQPAGRSELTRFLCRSGSPEAIQGIATEWDAVSPFLRYQIISYLAERMTNSSPSPIPRVEYTPQEVSALIPLLIRSLTDVSQHESFRGQMNRELILCPRVCDYALWVLHKISPADYPFSPAIGRAQLDLERLTVANRWRAKHGEVALPIPRAPSQQLSAKDALKVVSIHFDADQSYPEIETAFNELRGKALQRDSLSKVMTWFALSQMPNVTGLEIEAHRGIGLTGVQLQITIHPGKAFADRPWEFLIGAGVGDRDLGIYTGLTMPGYAKKDKTWESLTQWTNDAVLAAPEAAFVLVSSLKMTNDAK